MGFGMSGYSSNDRAHEILIAGIVHIIIMGEVAVFFFFVRQVVHRMHSYRLAIGAAEIALVMAIDVCVV